MTFSPYWATSRETAMLAPSGTMAWVEIPPSVPGPCEHVLPRRAGLGNYPKAVRSACRLEGSSILV